MHLPLRSPEGFEFPAPSVDLRNMRLTVQGPQGHKYAQILTIEHLQLASPSAVSSNRFQVGVYHGLCAKTRHLWT